MHPSSPFPLKTQRNTSKQGFALIIALSLMAFILLLMISLGSMVMVERQVSTATLQQSQARQNARLALDMALGNLQRLAGPDQRATATADILSAENYTATEADTHAKHWTGVWDSTMTRQTGFLGWLVSSHNNILLSDEADAVNLPANTVTLVGAGTLGNLAPADEYVNVPLMPVSYGPYEGRLGYWVGDEGVKAKFQGTLPSSDIPSSARAEHDFRLNQRNAVETYGDLSTQAIGDELSAQASKQPRSVSWEDIFIPDTAETILPADNNTLKAAYFDFTPNSTGLLTNTQHGGWQKDLTWLFEASNADAAVALDSIDAVPGVADAQITADWPEDRGQPHWAPAPTWDMLRAYYRLNQEIPPMAIRPQTATQPGIAPVVTHFIINFLPGLSGMVHENTTPGDSSDDYFVGKLRIYMDVQIVLWNPYDTAIELPESDLEILWRENASGILPDMKLQFGDYPSASATHSGTLMSDFTGPAGEGFFNYVDSTDQNLACTGLSFRLPNTVMAPGEVLIYSISDDDDGEGYTGTNVLENNGQAGAPNALWLEHPAAIGQSSSPLNGHQVLGDFTFEKLDMDKTAGDTILVQHIALKKQGTAGDDDPAHEGDYYGRFMQQQKGSSSVFPQTSNLRSLATEVFGSSKHTSIASPSYYADHWLQMNLYMQGSQAGYRNSRWLRNYNPRASYTRRSEVDLYNNPLYAGNWNCGPLTKLNKLTTAGDNIRVAERPIHYGSYANQYQLGVYSLPSQGDKPMSLGDLQHANLYPQITSNNYLIGNSLIDLRLADTSETVRMPSDPDEFAPIVDGAYLLNKALWDDYFFSTIDGSVTQADLDADAVFPNSRIRLAHTASLADVETNPERFDSGAADLTLDGAFNINSTSKEAWKAVLASSNGLVFDPQSESQTGSQGVAFSRLMNPNGSATEAWRGYRELTDVELETLAEAIVAEIKLRGPFLTLSDFVNRELGAPADGAGLQGALDQAIVNANINSNTNLGLPPDTNELASINSTAKSWYIEEALVGSRTAGSTRWLIQGDILQKIGAMIRPRSDTFIIRTYGQSTNTISGETAMAYLEAVVQRTAYAVTPAPGEPYTPSDNLGRRFEIIGMRWLSEDEI